MQTWGVLFPEPPADCPLVLLQDAARGLLFPRFSSIQEVSARLTAKVAQFMVEAGGGAMVPSELVGEKSPDWEAYVASTMYKAPPASKL